VANPVHYAAHEDDAERTQYIPRVPDDPTEQIPKVNGDRRRGMRPRQLGWTPEVTAEPEEAPRGRHRKPGRKQPLWRELLVLFTVAILLTILIQHFLGRVYSIPSGSMEQTLHGCTGCTGDRVLVDKLVYRFNDPGPGDVIVFKGPGPWTQNDGEVPQSSNFVARSLRQLGSLVGLAPPNERDFVKRVIATGGQTVECCDAQNRVLVNGVPLDEPYVYWGPPGSPQTQAKFAKVTVPDGTLWVMGDNRNDSCDSRCQGGGGVNGVVPLDDVIGKARYIVLPPSRWRGIGDHNPQATPALGAAAWQEGLPAGVGFLAALPIFFLYRRRHRRRTTPR
jgi:signal peptidase I